MESQNLSFSSLKKSDKRVIVGVDEAGRGPVIGYMVYCVMVFEVDNVPKNLKDSKMLTEKMRNDIFVTLKDYNYAYTALHPSYITTKMLSNVNLNDISWNTVLNLLKLVCNAYTNIEGIFIDAIGTCDKLKEFLELNIKHKCTVESKADSKYPVVSGASIVAKVTRDDLLSKFNISFGSGYPSDPVTKKWLTKEVNYIFGWGKSVRYTWNTAKNILGYNKSKKFTRRLSGFYVHAY